MARNKLADLVNDGDGVQIALALGLSPGEEAVAAQHDAVTSRVFAYGVAHHQPKFKSRALPGNPDEGVVELAVEFLHLLFSVGGGGQGDAPVGMEVVNVGKRK